LSEPKKLLYQVRDALRIKHYSYRTEQTYLDWIKRFIIFHNKRHPVEMGAPDVQAFISFLAVDPHVAASTHTVLAVGVRESRQGGLLGHKEVKPTMIHTPGGFVPPVRHAAGRCQQHDATRGRSKARWMIDLYL
jgi:hypothetical protein